MISRTLPQSSVLTDRTSLSLPDELSIEQWLKFGRQIFTLGDSSSWWLGDWLIYGQTNYPDRYRDALKQTELSYQTLRNYAWIARQFCMNRRRKNLSFQHHAEVVSAPREHQDIWLDRAEKFGWSRNELRKRIKASLQSTSQTNTKEANVQVKIKTENKQHWKEAAHARNMDLESWIVAVLNEAATSGHTRPTETSENHTGATMNTTHNPGNSI